MLNDDLVGDAVLLLGPDIPVGLDGRNDVYGRPLLVELRNVFQGGAQATQWLNKQRVTCVLAPTTDALVRQLEHNPDWESRGSDQHRTLLVRQGT